MELLVKGIELFFSYIILRGIVAPILTRLFKKTVLYPGIKWFQHHFIRSERDLAIFLHNRNKALNKGHQHKDPWHCEDGHCYYI